MKEIKKQGSRRDRFSIEDLITGFMTGFIGTALVVLFVSQWTQREAQAQAYLDNQAEAYQAEEARQEEKQEYWFNYYNQEAISTEEVVNVEK